MPNRSHASRGSLCSAGVSEARAYLNAEQLAATTPWSVDAIEQMVRRGLLVRGIHYFQPSGPRTQRIFKWAAIAAWIERDSANEEITPEAVPARGTVEHEEHGSPDVGRIAARAAELRRLHAD